MSDPTPTPPSERCAFTDSFYVGKRCRHVRSTHETEMLGANHCAECHSNVIGTFCCHAFVPAPKSKVRA